jgi:hypothetical protein
MPEDVISFLWPRVWSWIQFQCEFLALDTPGAEDDDQAFQLSALHLETICKLAFNKTPEVPHQVINETPGVRVGLMRAWRCIIGDDRAQTGSFFELMNGLVHFDNPDHVREILRGAGGESTDLASLIVQQLEIFASDIHRDRDGRQYLPTLIYRLLRVNY